MRPVITWSVAACLAIAAAPWLSGGQEPLAGLISGFTMLAAVALLGRQPMARQLRGGPLTSTYLALVGWSALSLIWTTNRYSSLVWLVALVLVGLVFRLAYAVGGEPDGRQRLIWLYLGTAVIFTIYGVYLYLGGGYDRLTGPFYWPNPAAAYLIPGIFVSFDAWRRGQHWVYGIIGTVLGAGFVLTDSRAAGVVMALLVLVYALCVGLKRRFWITFVFGLVASVGVAYGLVWVRHEMQPTATVSAPGSRLAPAASGNLQSGADRVKYLESAFHIWSDHPLLGTGAGTFADVHPKYQERVISASTSVHDVYVQTFAELGIFGGLLLIWLMLILGAGVIRGLWNNYTGLAAALGLAGLWLHFGLDIDAQYPALVLTSAMLAGALYYQRPRYRSVGWRLPVMSLAVLVPIVGLYLSDNWSVRGQTAQTNGDFTQAAADFAMSRHYLVYNPDVLSAEGINRYTLAEIGESGQRQQALGLALAAEKQDPSDAQHYQLEGFVRQLGGDRSGAATAFRQALRLDPYNHPEYAYDLSLVQAETGQSAAALATADAMLDQYPPVVLVNRSADPQIKSNLAQLAVLEGTIHLQAGDIAAAKAASVRALKFDSANARAEALAEVLLHSQ